MINTIKTLVIISAVFAFPSAAFAATAYFDVAKDDTIYVGDTFIASVRLSGIDKPINVADGSIFFDKDKLQVSKLSTGGSIFLLWTKFPEFSNEEGTVSFIGGVPGGFLGGGGEILKIAFLAKSAGEANLDFSDTLSLFLNDGTGTKTGLWLRPETIPILERPAGKAPRDEWQEIVSQDKTPPDPFEVVRGKDPAIFDNKHFIAFSTTDSESGIDYYEVREGDGDFVRAASPYVLKNQSGRDLIQVKAVDKAGNEKISELKLKKLGLAYKIVIAIAAMIAILVTVYTISRRKRKRS